jgi:hypothetical protein
MLSLYFDRHIPSYFFEEKERRGGTKCRGGPLTANKKNPKTGLHFECIKPPRPDTAIARLANIPIHFVAGGEIPLRL